MGNFDTYLTAYGSRYLLPFVQKTFRAIGQQQYGSQDGEAPPDLDRYAMEFPLYGDVDITNEYDAALHSRYICGALDWWVRTPGARLIITTPPRHGKSELCTVRLPAFVAGRFPGSEFVAASYAQNLINSLSRKARAVVQSDSYQEIFPDAWVDPNHSQTRTAVEEWECANGSKFKAVGIGAGLTGYGINFGTIDDPYKGRKEAESIVVQEGVIDWWKAVFLTRLMPGARILIVMTRWQRNDLVGFILNSEGKEEWRIINLRAISRGPTDDPLGRPEGAPLWAARFPLVWLLKRKEELGAYDWSSLYDGEPIPPGGELINPEDFLHVDRAPAELQQQVRFWDLAVSESQKADKTASVRMGIDRLENLYLFNPVCGQWNWPRATEVILTSCKIEGPGIPVGIEEAGQQKGLIDGLKADRRFRPYSIFGYPVPASKRVRALPWIAKAEAHKVFLVGKGWTYFKDCCRKFTGLGDEEDDLIDATSGAYQMLIGAKPMKKKHQVYVGRF